MKTRSRSVRTIALIGDARKERAAAALSRHEAWLARRFAIVVRDFDGTADLSTVRADLAVLFGGDGSILSVARRLAGNPLPVLGVNTGRLGFLAEVPLEDFRTTFSKLLMRPLRTSSRMMFDVTAGGARRLALNDAVIARGTVARMTHLRLSFGGAPLMTIAGDGLIVATPSGSTAHSLSAGGPIVHPELEAAVVTPICAHALSSRPIVLPADREIRVDLPRRNARLMLTVDGQELCALSEGDSVSIRRAARPFRLVDCGVQAYTDALRLKMNWGGAFVEAPR
jgi:NAD+ kinase